MRTTVLALGLCLALPATAQTLDAEPLYGTVELEAGFTPDPYALELVAGGATPNPIAGEECVGYIETAQADVLVEYTAAGSVGLAFRAEGAGDTALLVHLPTGEWRCSDDADGVDPAVLVANPASGPYHVWVASYSSGPVDATLLVSEGLAKGPVAPGAAGEPLHGSVVLRTGFTPDPYTLRVAPGGPDNLDVPDCPGAADPSRPSAELVYVAGTAYGLAVSVDGRAGLVVRTPLGETLCDAEAVVLDSPTSGTYRLWATALPDSGPDVTLSISERPRGPRVPDPNAPPVRGPLALLSTPVTLDLTPPARPDVPLASYGCAGAVDGLRPDVVLDATSGAVSFALADALGLALLVRTPDGRWVCDDDTDGLDAALEVVSSAGGLYAVWIGGSGGEPPTQLTVRRGDG